MHIYPVSTTVEKRRFINGNAMFTVGGDVLFRNIRTARRLDPTHMEEVVSAAVTQVKKAHTTDDNVSNVKVIVI